jgi:integrase
VPGRLLVEPDEEAMLLATAAVLNSPEHDFVGEMMTLRIVAAIDTGMRRGEMLLVQNHNVDYREGLIKLPKYAEVHGVEVQGTKTGETRVVPITPRLAKLMEPRRTLGPSAYVFGTRAGVYQENFTKTWTTLRLLAHGHTPQWTAKHGLAKPSQQTLKAIDLHWHDLRHEGASRYGQSGKFSLKELMELLGHRLPQTTMRYWNLGEGAVKKAVLAAALDIAADRAKRDEDALAGGRAS